MNIGALLLEGTRQLEEAGVADPKGDARKLMRFALGPGASSLDPQAAPTRGAVARYRDAIAARAARKPVSHITGLRAFWRHEFHVTPDTLDPRPETERIIEEAVLYAPPERILDLGTGTGALLLSLLAEFPKSTGLGTDVSEAALEIARANAEALGLEARARFAASSWLDDVAGTFDLIVSNPPYIPATEIAQLAPEVRLWEPQLALSGGPDGLAPYRQIAAHLERHLAPGGHAFFEFGAGQGPDVQSIFSAAGFARTRLLSDLSGKLRVLHLFPAT